jgi:tetratricopeptide (TPR) repeat protein
MTNIFVGNKFVANNFSGKMLDRQKLNNLAWLFFKNKYMAHLEKAEAWCREALDKEKGLPDFYHTLAAILGGMGRWEESLKLAQQFLNKEGFIQKEIRTITEYFISAAAEGYAADAIPILEQHADIPSLEPIVAGLKTLTGQKFLTAQEIREIGYDIAERIKKRMNKNVENKRAR